MFFVALCESRELLNLSQRRREAEATQRRTASRFLHFLCEPSAPPRLCVEKTYVTTDSLQMVNKFGGLATARKLLQRNEPSSGFAELWECGALDLTVEAQSLRQEAVDRFSEEQRAIVCRRLAEFG